MNRRGRVLLLLATTVALGGLFALWWERDGAPQRPRDVLGPATPFDRYELVSTAEAAGDTAGTAFSISDRGVWLTARHVVENCRRTAIVVAPGHGVIAEPRLFGMGETAILITKGGEAPLVPAPGGSLKRRMTAWHPGYPGDAPAVAVSRLVGRRTLVEHGARLALIPVLVWKRAPEDGAPHDLRGLSGGPALNAAGQVVGVTIAADAQTGEVFTTTVNAVRIATRRAGVDFRPGAMDAPALAQPEAYAAGLRRRLSIAQVVCLNRS